jgi:acetyl esterase/lipase
MMTMMRAALALLLIAGATQAQTPAPGPREVPAHTVPVPDTVSPASQALIAAPYNPVWSVAPKSAAEWHKLVDDTAALAAKAMPELREKLHVTSQPVTIDGVKAYMLTPAEIPPANRNRLLVHVHGGAYTLFPGESGTREGVILAGYGHFKVLSVDYRMPPDFPYPAAMDDAMTVWKAVLKQHKPRNLGIFGTSTGGGMTLAMVLRAKAEHLPLPAAIAPGTPWSDLTKTGDSYFANAMLDNVLVAYEGFLESSAIVYANGHDLKDPLLSPIYGDMHGFPPTILTSGTRDLFLSNTVRVHRKLRQAGVEAVLQVYEGLSHAAYNRDPFAPENREVFEEIARFFDKHLAK